MDFFFRKKNNYLIGSGRFATTIMSGALTFAVLISCTEKATTTAGPNLDTTAELKVLSVASTDPDIQYNPTANHLYRECDGGMCSDDQHLVVFFPGSDGNPSDHTKIATVLGKTGVRVLVLAYQNNNSLQNICGTTDSCYTNARQDRVEGATSSSYVTSPADGVINRLLKALQTLGWSNFYSGNSISWNKITVGGFSQGAGVAAWIGKHYLVSRVCQFSGTWDHTTGTTAATWLNGASTTPSTNFYGFTHKDDSLTNGANYLDLNWQVLGMGNGSLQLYNLNPTGQKLYTDETDATCTANAHGCSVVDSVTPIDAEGNPKFSSAWKYTCGR